MRQQTGLRNDKIGQVIGGKMAALQALARQVVVGREVAGHVVEGQVGAGRHALCIVKEGKLPFICTITNKKTNNKWV